MADDIEDMIRAIIRDTEREITIRSDSDVVDVLINICTTLENINDTLKKMYSGLISYK